MYTINSFSIAQIIVWKDLLNERIDLWGARFTKPESNTVKEITFAEATEYENWFLFSFQDVAEPDEDLDGGKVYLNGQAGEWIMDILTKSEDAINWTVSYTDLFYMKPTEQIIKVYDV